MPSGNAGGSGIPPAAVWSLPGVNKIGSFPARPDVAPGGALLPSRRATPGFGTGGTIRTRTGGLVIPNHARFLCATAPCGRAIGTSYRTAAVFPMRHRSFPVAGSSFRSAREQKKRGDKGGMPAPLCRRQVSNLLPLAFRQRTARCATAACTEIS